jgi:ATP-dependent Clp protease ATP-binding subunit ClpB
VDFRNTVVIMTSNLGTHLIQGEKVADDPFVKERIWEVLRGHFRPEFLNRIDEVIVFNQLGRDQIKNIVEIQLGSLRKRLSERGITLTLTERAKEVLAEDGYDASFGARPLKRSIQRLIQDPLAKRILSGEFPEGSTVEVDAGHEGQLMFRREESAVAA